MLQYRFIQQGELAKPLNWLYFRVGGADTFGSQFAPLASQSLRDPSLKVISSADAWLRLPPMGVPAYAGQVEPFNRPYLSSVSWVYYEEFWTTAPHWEGLDSNQRLHMEFDLQSNAITTLPPALKNLITPRKG